MRRALCEMRQITLIAPIAIIVVCACAVVGAQSSAGSLADPNSEPAGSLPEPNNLDWSLARTFHFTLDAVELSAKVLSGAESQATTRTVTISVTVDAPDVTRLVTIDVEMPEILEVLDQEGRSLEYEPDEYYRVRRYEDLNNWRSLSRSFSMTLRLSRVGTQSVPSTISLLKAYIYALYAEDLVGVDVPFDRSSGCMETQAAPGLLFCVDPRLPLCPGPYSSGVPPQLYRWTTWVRAKTGGLVMALRDTNSAYPRHMYPLSDFAVLRTDLLDSRKGTSCHVVGRQWVQSGGGTQGARCWGEMEQAPSDAYDSIRHIIAVHPVEVKIPFVLRNVPVPALQPGAEKSGG